MAPPVGIIPGDSMVTNAASLFAELKCPLDLEAEYDGDKLHYTAYRHLDILTATDEQIGARILAEALGVSNLWSLRRNANFDARY